MNTPQETFSHGARPPPRIPERHAEHDRRGRFIFTR